MLAFRMDVQSAPSLIDAITNSRATWEIIQSEESRASQRVKGHVGSATIDDELGRQQLRASANETKANLTSADFQTTFLGKRSVTLPMGRVTASRSGGREYAL